MKALIVAFILGLAGLLAWLTLGPTSARHDLLLGGIQARPMGEGVAAVYLVFDNRGAPDRLLSVASPAGRAMLYSPESETGLPIPTGMGAMLAADGAHVMLSGLDNLEEGALIPLAFTFEEAGTLNVKAKVGKPKAAGAAGDVGHQGHGEIFVVPEGEPRPSVAIRVTREGPGWQVALDTEGFTFGSAETPAQHVPGMGHGHLYVSGLKMGRVYGPTATIGPLPAGTHLVRVTLNTNDHRAYVVGEVPVSAEVSIEVPED